MLQLQANTWVIGVARDTTTETVEAAAVDMTEIVTATETETETATATEIVTDETIMAGIVIAIVIIVTDAVLRAARASGLLAARLRKGDAVTRGRLLAGVALLLEQ